jgi:hypothetical protein
MTSLSGMPGSTIAINPSNIAAMIQAGYLVVLGTDNTTTNPYVEHNHCYAVLSYTPGASLPFTLFNPWGINGGYDSGGHFIWGEFICDAQFLSSNFFGGAYATGKMGGQQDLSDLGARPAQDRSPQLAVSGAQTGAAVQMEAVYQVLASLSQRKSLTQSDTADQVVSEGQADSLMADLLAV